ncbi:TIGR02556 family CRISPR-associated protein [Caldicellulosiruptoraceae bacterium PP1]
MITSVMELGKMQKTRNKDTILSYIDEPDVDKVIAIRFQYQSNNQKNVFTFNQNEEITINNSFIKEQLVLKDILLEDCLASNKNKYLLSKAAANGPNFTPTAKVTKIEITNKNDTLSMKIIGYFKKVLSEFSNILTSQEKSFLEILHQLLTDNEINLKESIIAITKDMPKKVKKLLTIKIIIDDDKEIYIGQFDFMKKIMSNWINQKNSELSVDNKVCSICGQTSPQIYAGNASPYKFYTIDKRGFIRNGFNEKDSWKNFPICPDCTINLKEGKNFIEKNLTFKFYGLSYQLIPTFVIGQDFVRQEIVDYFKSGRKDIKINSHNNKRITNDENEILGILSEENDTLTLNILFLESSGGSSAEKILLLIEDVLPSRLKMLFNAKTHVDNLLKYDDIKFNFGAVRYFFEKSDKNKRERDLDKYFLEITNNVFKGFKLDFYFLLNFMMNKIRFDFNNYNCKIKIAATNALMSLLFFDFLNLIEWRDYKMNDNSLFNAFFSSFGNTFNSYAKRGIFLLGVLSKMLLNKQYKERKSTPFAKNLKSLKLTQQDILGLLPKVQNKFEEYNSFDKGKREIANQISKYLLQAGDKWNMPIDEINFYFASGMNMVKEIAQIVYKDEKEIEEVSKDE